MLHSTGHLQAFSSAPDQAITPQHYKELLMETNTLTLRHFVCISSDLDVKCYSWLLLNWDGFRPEFDLQQSHYSLHKKQLYILYRQYNFMKYLQIK